MSDALDLLKAQGLAYFETHPQRVTVVAAGEEYPGLFDAAPRTNGGSHNERHSEGPVLTLFTDHLEAIKAAIGRNDTLTVDGTEWKISQFKNDESDGIYQGNIWLL